MPYTEDEKMPAWKLIRISVKEIFFFFPFPNDATKEKFDVSIAWGELWERNLDY